MTHGGGWTVRLHGKRAGIADVPFPLNEQLAGRRAASHIDRQHELATSPAVD